MSNMIVADYCSDTSNPTVNLPRRVDPDDVFDIYSKKSHSILKYIIPHTIVIKPIRVDVLCIAAG